MKLPISNNPILYLCRVYHNYTFNKGFMINLHIFSTIYLPIWNTTLILIRAIFYLFISYLLINYFSIFKYLSLFFHFNLMLYSQYFLLNQVLNITILIYQAKFIHFYACVIIWKVSIVMIKEEQKLLRTLRLSL